MSYNLLTYCALFGASEEIKAGGGISVCFPTDNDILPPPKLIDGGLQAFMSAVFNAVLEYLPYKFLRTDLQIACYQHYGLLMNQLQLRIFLEIAFSLCVHILSS